jgi:hypothetical protein
MGYNFGESRKDREPIFDVHIFVSEYILYFLFLFVIASMLSSVVMLYFLKRAYIPPSKLTSAEHH